MGHAREQRRFPVALGTAGLATGLFGACLHWSIGGDGVARVVSDVGTVLAGLAATALCLRAGGRQARPRLRLFWSLLAGACGAWTLGEMSWTWYDFTGSGEQPIPSLADVGYLAFMPLAAAALLVHPGMRDTRTRKARALLDGLAIAAALLFLSWVFVLGPLWRSTDLTAFGGLVMLAYPFGDVVLAFFVVLAVRRIETQGRRELWCLLGGLVAMALADSVYAYVAQVNAYATGTLLDAGWFAGLLGIALGAFSADAHVATARNADSSLPGLPSLVVPFLPMLLALGVVAIELTRGRPLDPPSLIIAFGLVVIVLARQALLVVDFVTASKEGHQADPVERLAHAALGDARRNDAEASRLRSPRG